ncbi:MAG: hypothetical protein NC452_15520 [Eubacterium sp.]|nr:hypothetical protein [Eubacterium sp.]
MIIDARNLNPNYTSENRQASLTASQNNAEALVRQLEKSENAYCSIKQEPLQRTSNLNTMKSDFYSYDSGLDVSKIEMVRVKRHYELDYTADDALNNCWNASVQGNVFALYKSCSMASDEAVADMDKGEFLTYLRENGLDKEINWTGIERNLRGEKTFDNFSEFTDYTAALFAGLEDRIKTDFSGDEQNEQLNILSGLYEKAVKDFADSIWEKAEGAFGALGADLPKDTLEASIRQVIDDKRNAYSEFIKNNKDYAGVEGTADSWLKRDVGFMTDALRKAYAPADIQSDGELWSENDIIAIGMVGNMYQYDGLYSKACQMIQHKDEESVGLAMSMQWLATEKVTVDLGVSDSVKGLINGLFEKYAKTLIDDVNFALDKAGSNPLGADSTAFARLDEKSVYAVLDVMKETFKESGDAEKAIYATTSFAHDTAMSKLEKEEYNSLWRYNKPLEGALDAKRFWGSFYDPDSKSRQGNGMGKLLQKWNTFSEIMGSKDLFAFKMNTCINMFRGYGTRTLSGPISGGYEKGQYWGTNLEDVVKSLR